MAEQKSTFEAELNSSFEPWLIKNICEPVLKYVPLSVAPNSISLAGSFACWLMATLAYISTELTGAYKLAALLGAGAFMMVSMVADCLDGMQARRTNRCSKLGEMMDHWLDSAHVPLVTVGLCLALEPRPWAVVLIHITNTMIYNGQLVLYHHRGRFVHANTGGPEAEFGVAIGYVGIGLLFGIFGRHNIYMDVGVLIASVIAIYTQMKINYFYYARLKKDVIHHLPFVLLCGGFGALYLTGAITQLAFLLCVVFCSFRITGGYVQYTILGRRFSGMDWGIAAWIVGMAGYYFLMDPVLIFGFKLYKALPFFACLYMAGRSMWEFVRYYHELKPAGLPDDNDLRPA